jgi:hypothetical protein
MRNFYAALGLLAITCAPACAQVGFGPEVGLNVSNYMVKTNGSHIKSDFKLGGIIGGMFDIQLSNQVYLQPSILYVTNGYKLDFLSGSRLYILHALEVPVMVTYKFATPGCNRFFVGAGPFVTYNWDGVMRTVVDQDRVNSRNDLELGNGATDEMTRWDVGGRIAGGYQMAEGLYFRAQAQLSALNIRPDQYVFPNSSLVNYNFGVSVGYLFGNKNRVKTKKVKVSTSAVPQQPAANATNATNPTNAAGTTNPQTAPAPNNATQKKPEPMRFDK